MNSFTLNQLKTRWKNDTFGEIFLDWKWIFSYSRRFKGPIAAYTVLGLLSSTLGLVSSVAGKFLVDVVIGHKSDQLWMAALIMAGSALISLAISNLIGRIRQKLNVDMTNAIRGDVFDSVMDAGWQSLNQFSNGDILNRFHGDIGTVADNAISWLPGVIISVYSFVSTFIVIWYYSPVMSLIAARSGQEHRAAVREMQGGVTSFVRQAAEDPDVLASWIHSVCSFGNCRCSTGALPSPGICFRSGRMCSWQS